MHDHAHGHGHFKYCTREHDCWCEQNRYLCALVIALGIAIIEMVGWWQSGSIALFGDIGHVLSDAAGFGFAFILSIYIRKKVSRKRRTLRIAGFAFQLILLAVTVGWIAMENVSRFYDPPPVVVGPLIIAATLGAIGNVLQLWVLRELHHLNINALAAWWHAALDFGSSVAVIIGGIVLWVTGYAKADPIAAFVVLLLLVGHILFVFRKAARRQTKQMD